MYFDHSLGHCIIKFTKVKSKNLLLKKYKQVTELIEILTKQECLKIFFENDTRMELA